VAGVLRDVARGSGLFGMTSVRNQPMRAPPVDKLKMVTPYPKARATMNDTRLRSLAPAGTPIVLHLYTG